MESALCLGAEINLRKIDHSYNSSSAYKDQWKLVQQKSVKNENNDNF